jgi:RNA polymerase sigma-70 factor (ECF subfamily)
MNDSEQLDDTAGEGGKSSGAAHDPVRDRALAARIRSGDIAAFTTVFHLYYAVLVRFVARYLGSRDAAEDVVQDLFTRLWDLRDNIDPARSLRAYLFTMARHRAANVREHDVVVQQHAARIVEQWPERSMVPAADALVLTDELARIVEARVATLSPRLQEIYHLSRDDGLSTSEIAETLGIATQTVYLQLAKVVRILYETLEPWVDG